MSPELKTIVACADARKAGYHMALALNESGELDTFFTSVYVSPVSWIGQKLIRPFPRLATRYIPGLPASKVSSVVTVDLIRKAPFLKKSSQYAVDYFDKVVSRHLSNQTWLLAALDTCSIYTISRAKKLGIKIAILCVAPSNSAWDNIRTEEIKLHPQIANSNDAFLSSPEWIKKRREQDLKFADVLIAYSSFIKSTLLEQGVDERKICIVHKGLDDPYLPISDTLSSRKEFIDLDGNKDKKFKILFVGNLGWRKGIFYLLEAMKKACLPDTSLMIAGGGSEWLNLIDSAKQDIHIKLFGSVPQAHMDKLYRSADVFFFPSLLEGAAQVTYEAMSFGLPIITTHNSGSLVEDGYDGFVVPVRDTDAMADRLRQLFYDPKLRAKMRQNALDKSKEITWSKYREGIRSCLYNYT